MVQIPMRTHLHLPPLDLAWALVTADILGTAVTNAEAWFNKSLRPRKPEGSLDGQPRKATSTLTQLLNYGNGIIRADILYGV